MIQLVFIVCFRLSSLSHRQIIYSPWQPTFHFEIVRCRCHTNDFLIFSIQFALENLFILLLSREALMRFQSSHYYKQCHP